MAFSDTPPRSPRGEDTRTSILATAERLFAVHGMAAVSNRQICEAAGQANNSVIAYHFGSRADLVRAIVRRHQADIEARRLVLLEGADGCEDLRAWINRLVRPITDHYAALGRPSWYARFAAQATTDPGLREFVVDEVTAMPTMRRTLEAITRLVPALPEHVQRQRTAMTRLLIVHLCAEVEQALHDRTAATGWEQTADSLTDALMGIWTGPWG